MVSGCHLSSICKEIELLDRSWEISNISLCHGSLRIELRLLKLVSVRRISTLLSREFAIDMMRQNLTQCISLFIDMGKFKEIIFSYHSSSFATAREEVNTRSPTHYSSLNYAYKKGVYDLAGGPSMNNMCKPQSYMPRHF